MPVRFTDDTALSLRHIRKLTIACALVAVAACGGDDDNAQTRDGNAIDGYLLNAQVCVDVNFNAECDGSEASTTTSSLASQNGKFTIRGIQRANRNAPTLVRAVDGQTVDSDDPTGNPVSTDFDMKAPASAKVVTPLTTLVQAEAEDLIASSGGGTDVDDAVKQAKQNIENLLDGSSDIDLLNEDYVAAQQDADSTKATAARKAAATARAVNRILTSTRAEVDSRIDDTTRANLGDKTDAAILNTAITKVRGKVSQVSQQVNTAVDTGGEDVNLDDVVANAVNDPDNQVDDDELTNVVNEVTQEVEDLKKVEEETIEDEDTTGATGGSGS